MTTTRPNTVPSPDDIPGLRQAAIDHLFIGTRNAAQLAEDGGPMIVEDADGIYFTDSTGRQYVDGISGMYFRNAGHGRDEIAEAIYEQLKRVSMHIYVASTSSTVRLAARLAQIAPGGLTRTFFTSGGSESNETSIKMAQAYHNRTGGKGRFKVISRKGSYHGGTWGTMWLGSHPFLPREEYQPVPSNAVHVPNPNPYRCELGGSTPEECAELCANAVEEAILFHHPDSVSAVIGEPITQPLGGVVPGPWVLGPGAGDLRQVRGAAHFRRSDNRIRANRRLVRGRYGGRRSGHHELRQGRHLRLLPDGRLDSNRRGFRRLLRRPRQDLQAHVHLYGSPGRRRRRAGEPRHHGAGGPAWKRPTTGRAVGRTAARDEREAPVDRRRAGIWASFRASSS